MNDGILRCFPSKQRGAIGRRFTRAIAAGACTSATVIATVRAAALARGNDLDGQVVLVLAQYPVDAHDYADWHLWRAALTAEEQQLVDAERARPFRERRQKAEAPSDAQLAHLRRSGDTAPVANKWEASQRIDALHGTRASVPTPPAHLRAARYPLPAMLDRRAYLSSLTPRPEEIPAALRELGWVAWMAVDRGDGITKAPIDVRTGDYARVNDPDTFAPFEHARAYYARRRDLVNGIGCLLGSGIFGVDLDHCRDPETGGVVRWATEIMARFAGTYMEFSPSQGGIRIFGRGRLPGPGRKVGKVEVYDTARFLTVTGWRIPGKVYGVAACQEALDWLCASLDRKVPDDAEQGAAEGGDRSPRAAPRAVAPIDLTGLDGAGIWEAVAPALSPRMRACAMGDDAVRKADGTPYESASNRHEAVLMALLRTLDDNAATAAFLATPRGREFLDTNRVREPDMGRRLGRAVANARAHMRADPAIPRSLYFDVDAAILDHAAALGLSGVALFAALSSHLPNVRPSEGCLAREIGATDRTVRTHLKALARLRLVAISTERLSAVKSKNHYTLVATAAPTIRVPRRLLGAGLGPAAIATYLAIGGREAGMPATRQGIAAQLGVTRPVIAREMNALVAHGFVIAGERAASAPQPYYVVDAPPTDVRFLPPNLHGAGGGSKGGGRGELAAD